MKQSLTPPEGWKVPESGQWKVLPILALLPCILMLPLPAKAQGFSLTHGEWEASFFYGGSLPTSGTHVTPVEGSGQNSPGTVGLRYAKGYMIGVSLSQNPWEHWGAALEYVFSNQPMTFTNLSDSIPSLSLGQSVHRFAYDVVYYPRGRHQRLRPYAFAGPGIALFYIKGASKDAASVQGITSLSDPWKFTMNWGGGVKYLVREHAVASFQFSDSVSGVPGYGLPEIGKTGQAGYVAGFRPDGLMNNWLVSVGFTYQWETK